VFSAKRLLCVVAVAALTVGALASGGSAAGGGAAAEPDGPAFLTGPNGGAPLDVALGYLKQHLSDYGLTAADVGDVVATRIAPSAQSGMTTIHLQQRYRGVEVFNAFVYASVARNGSLINLHSSFVGGLAGKVNGLEPAVSREAAAGHAAQALGLSGTAAFRVVREQGGRSQAAELSTGGIALSPIPVSLVLQPQGNQVRLAWQLEIEQLDAKHWWNARVDAANGALLASLDYSADVNDGSSYKVYALPKENPDSGPRTIEANPSEDTASPFGWHDTNGAAGPEFKITRGNNAHAYVDAVNDGQPDPGGEPKNNKLDFKFKLNLGQDPPLYKLAAATNLFYYNNIIHDVFYLYGFDEASENFQQNNYGRGGLANDYVQAEAQDGGGSNNANFSTPPDGQRPRMQMYLWTFTSPRRDGDLDNAIIAHEYGHGISRRLNGVSCMNNAEQMGEGWSDWFGIVLSPRAGDTGPTPRGMGTYVLGQPREGRGIRPTQYSTDMSINPTTYDDIKRLAIPHGVGYAWATMIWEVYWNLIADHGFNPDIYGSWETGGNNLAVQLIIDGLKLQPCSSGFVDGRDAILLADQNLTGGDNKCAIWRGFAKRGLGKSADQGSSNSTQDGVEAFDLPRACR
jgi:extracellular elastinolytic metalloproteinase